MPQLSQIFIFTIGQYLLRSHTVRSMSTSSSGVAAKLSSNFKLLPRILKPTLTLSILHPCHYTDFPFVFCLVLIVLESNQHFWHDDSSGAAAFRTSLGEGRERESLDSLQQLENITTLVTPPPRCWMLREAQVSTLQLTWLTPPCLTSYYVIIDTDWCIQIRNIPFE